MKLPDLPLVILDTETTGFLPKVNRVIEYAHVVIRDGKTTDTCEELFSIDGEIPDVVRVLTRITGKDLAGKPKMEERNAEILKRIGEDTLIVGQNVGFDLKMLRGEGIDLTERPWIDTSMLASLVFPELESYSLGYVSSVLNLNHEPVHRALGDVRATMELLGKCWERILELPEEFRDDFVTILKKSSPGYRMLAEVLPKATKKKSPEWLKVPTYVKQPQVTTSIKLPDVAADTVNLLEEPLEPTFLEQIIRGAVEEKGKSHWIAVKNLTATVRHLHIPDGVRVLLPPNHLLDPEAVDALEAQETFTADEATLLLKLKWYDSTVESDLPVHGEERAVWGGKIACTDKSPTYVKQFQKLPNVVLMDHRQLLSLLADPDHEAHGALTPETRIIIDDASMLEDTATKAYGWYAGMDDLRAAASGNTHLMRITDLLQLWVEKTRNTQDLRYITPSDLRTPDVLLLRDHIDETLTDDALPPQTARLLGNIKEFFEEKRLADRIVWIETRQDGSQFIQSVPQSVALLLKDHLYSKFPTTLLIPQKSAAMLPEILVPGAKTKLIADLGATQRELPIDFPEERTAKSIICDPPAGRSIILVGSRRIIEQFFVEYTAALEEQGVALICQGLNGGLGRMQAEFLAAKEPVIWILTPWTFESVDLPPESVDFLAVETLPFDHPSHAVMGRRAERFKAAFSEYSMPRLLHRLFRLMRTFREIAKDDASVAVLDRRIREKTYGKTVRGYLSTVCKENTGAKSSAAPKHNADFPENWQMNLF